MAIADQVSTIETFPSHHIQPGNTQIAIRVASVGKMYRMYDRPQDRLKQMLWRGRRLFGREFWALHDVSFEVQKGEAIGIVGRNGSGKSTLLQIIAGTLAPTEGQVTVAGKVAALLELGSGFNTEYTGRENVFLNGAILGLTHEEMEQRFDDIAAFADIGDFIDQPVKLYSSGMMVRLAFAVQAHIQPDLLIIDEALSVGDVYFQHKCMRRIKELIDRGTTLLFVSHSTETVKRFCRRGLWLDGGECRYFGDAGVAVEKYLAFIRMREAKEGLPDLGSFDEPDEFAPRPSDLQAPWNTHNSTFSLPASLVLVSHTIDVADNGLFVRGHWTSTNIESAPLGRRTSDPEALAGFRCGGGTLDLAFLRGPHVADVALVVDGVERIQPLADRTIQRVEHIQVLLTPGEHIVLIKAAGRLEAGRELYWLGGSIYQPGQLEFRRDPHFGAHTGDVERYGSGKARITAVDLLDYNSLEPLSSMPFGQRVRLRLHAERLAPAGPRLEFSYIVRDRNRIDLFGTTTIDEHVRLDPQARYFVAEFAFDIHLGPGSYSILAAFVECSEDLTHKVPMDQVDIARVFDVSFEPSRPVWYVFHEPVVVAAVVSAALDGAEHMG